MYVYISTTNKNKEQIRMKNENSSLTVKSNLNHFIQILK